MDINKEMKSLYKTLPPIDNLKVKFGEPSYEYNGINIDSFITVKGYCNKLCRIKLISKSENMSIKEEILYTCFGDFEKKIDITIKGTGFLQVYPQISYWEDDK